MMAFKDYMFCICLTAHTKTLSRCICSNGSFSHTGVQRVSPVCNGLSLWCSCKLETLLNFHWVISSAGQLVDHKLVVNCDSEFMVDHAFLLRLLRMLFTTFLLENVLQELCSNIPCST